MYKISNKKLTSFFKLKSIILKIPKKINNNSNKITQFEVVKPRNARCDLEKKKVQRRLPQVHG